MPVIPLNPTLKTSALTQMGNLTTALERPRKAATCATGVRLGLTIDPQPGFTSPLIEARSLSATSAPSSTLIAIRFATICELTALEDRFAVNTVAKHSANQADWPLTSGHTIKIFETSLALLATKRSRRASTLTIIIGNILGRNRTSVPSVRKGFATKPP